VHASKARPAVATVIATVTAITAGVFLSIASSVPELLRAEGLGLVALFFATIALQFRSFDMAGNGSIGVSAVGMATAAVVIGTAAAMALAVLAALVQWRRRRGPLHRALFDVANFALASAAAGFTFAAVVGEPAVSPRTLLAAGLAGSAYVLVNNALLCFVMSVDEGRSARKVWEERFRWAVPTLFAFAPIVAFAAIAYERAALAGVAVVLGTPLLLSVAMKARLRKVGLAIPAQSELRLGRP
jgi:MYXO-CTERM domain-containing protein